MAEYGQTVTNDIADELAKRIGLIVSSQLQIETMAKQLEAELAQVKLELETATQEKSDAEAALLSANERITNRTHGIHANNSG